jgi:hypothetical protein
MKRSVDLRSMMRGCTLAALLSLVVPCFATVKVQPNAVGGTDPKPKKGTTTKAEAVVVIETLLSLFGL